MLLDEGMFVQIHSLEKDKSEIDKKRIINMFQSPFLKEILVVTAKDNLETARTGNMSDPEIKKQNEGAMSDAATEYIDLVVKHVIQPTFLRYINPKE